MIESEISQGKFLSKEGQVVLDQELRDVSLPSYIYTFGYC